MIRLALGLAALLALSGCAPDLSALAQDRNQLCAKMTTIWFSLDIDRNHGCPLMVAPAAVQP